MHEYLVGLHENFSIFLEELDFKFVEFFHRGDLWSKGDFFVINDIRRAGKITITDEDKWTTKKQFRIYELLYVSSTAVSIIDEAKQYITDVVNMMYEEDIKWRIHPNLVEAFRKDERNMKVKDLCNKVINTDPEVEFHPSHTAGIAFCVFCGAETSLPSFENVRHKEHCAVLLAKEILKEYE